MRRMLCAGALVVGMIGLGPGEAHASLNQGLLKLSNGRRACKAKRFAAGLKDLLDSALIIQRANPRHPANRQWLPAARTCLRSWVRHTARTCKKEGQPSALRQLLAIQKRVKYLAAPVVKRMIRRQLKPCARHIVKARVKECLATPNRAAVKQLDATKRTIRKLGAGAKALARLAKGRNKCAFAWIREAESRCKTSATVPALKEIGSGVGQVTGVFRAKARAAYEVCAQALGKAGWQLCQAKRYVRGRTILKSAIQRYGFFRARNKAFLRTMKRTWLPRCGAYLLSGFFNMRASQRGVAYKLKAQVRVEVSRTLRGNTLVGALVVTYSAVRGTRRGCRVLITPTNGRYNVTGSENRGAGKVTVMLDTGARQRVAKEEIQVTCGAQTPRQYNTRLVHTLLKKGGVFSMGLTTRSGSRTRYGWRGSFGRGAKGSVTGSVTLTVLK